jgi:hypothetical protein
MVHQRTTDAAASPLLRDEPAFDVADRRRLAAVGVRAQTSLQEPDDTAVRFGDERDIRSRLELRYQLRRVLLHAALRPQRGAVAREGRYVFRPRRAYQ